MKLIKNIVGLLSVALLVLQLFIDLHPSYGLSIEGRIFIVCVEIIGFTITYLYYLKDKDYQYKEKRSKIYTLFLFLIYLGNLGYLLFFDGEMGRSFTFIGDFSHLTYNVIPFHSIKLYINSYRLGYLPIGTIIINLLGNIVAFMPFAVFLPTLFKKQNKWYIYFITISLIIVLVEITQAITMSGTCDIDDYILNVLGSMIMFIFMKIVRKSDVK